jgi:hypothetical protein
LDNFELDHLDEISGTANEIEIPREAMGRGDLKFLACIGAFSAGVPFSSPSSPARFTVPPSASSP